MTTVEEQAALTRGSDLWHTTAAGGVAAITVTDGPHGVRLQGDRGPLEGRPATCFPPAVASACTWDPELLRRVGEAIGAEARALGVHVVLGPGVNLKRTPLNGRNFEYFSEDPLLTGRLAVGWVQGLQSRGVGASVKHFAVNSQETDRMRVSADVDERTLRELYLRAFGRVVREARPWTVMSAYNRINGVPASENRWLLTDVLRGEWGFEGLVVSDWAAVTDRVAAVAAGLDLAMPGPDEYGDRALVAAVADGTLPAESLATAAGRVRALVERAGSAKPDDLDEAQDTDAHHALAREVAARSIVLLRNENGLLPLDPGGPSVAVIGEYARTPRFQSGGSSQITPTRVDDALAAITAATSSEVRFAPGLVPGAGPDEALLAEAEQLARSSDVAVVLVGSDAETEGADRTSLDLPEAHRALAERVLAANPRTVVVLSNGGVVLTSPWADGAPALVEGWLLGQAGGSALAGVLFGSVNPSGRLAETIPLRLEDHPSYLDVPGEHGHVRYGEGGFVGYRGFDARAQDVAFPFGFGLSYTTFGYGAATATATDGGIEVRVPVTNTGDRDGRETVQVYVGVPGSAVRRPPRALAGFASVVLAAGETAEVTVAVDREDLAFWDVRRDRWVLERGTYRLTVGSHSRDARAVVDVELAGDDAALPLTADSTLGEWLSDPRGAAAVAEAMTAVAATSEENSVGALSADPAMLQLIIGVPLRRMATFPGSPLTPELMERLLAAVAD